MKVLVVGGGGREHALAWKLRQSPRVKTILVAPGNAGIAQCADCRPVAADDLPGLLALAQRERVDLTVVGPERPLALGIADLFAREGLRCIGPGMRAAELEASKAYAKIFMQRYRIPTAHYGVFADPKEAKHFVRRETLPIVIKADGLAQGKGVVIARTLKEADDTIDGMLTFGAYGDASRSIVIEQYLAGEEASCIALVDGTHFLLLESAQDHKALCDGDTGPNTGGMGAYSPAPVVTAAMTAQVRDRIIAPAVDGLAREGRPFVGFLYAGLMIVDGVPLVLEFNVRLGDPEAQALLVRLRSDLAELLLAAGTGTLHTIAPAWDPRPSACVVMAAGGYPDACATGHPIHGLETVAGQGDLHVFHSGTARHDDTIVTAGGRVLGVTALGGDIRAAVAKAYAGVAQITWEGAHYRKDIGWRAIQQRDT